MTSKDALQPPTQSHAVFTNLFLSFPAHFQCQNKLDTNILFEVKNEPKEFFWRDEKSKYFL